MLGYQSLALRFVLRVHAVLSAGWERSREADDDERVCASHLNRKLNFESQSTERVRVRFTYKSRGHSYATEKSRRKDFERFCFANLLSLSRTVSLGLRFLLIQINYDTQIYLTFNLSFTRLFFSPFPRCTRFRNRTIFIDWWMHNSSHSTVFSQAHTRRERARDQSQFR